MKMTLDEIRSAVNELSADEREILFMEFQFEKTEKIDPEIEKAWIEESKYRLQEILDGKVKTIPAEEVFEKIRKARTEKRPLSSSG